MIDLGLVKENWTNENPVRIIFGKNSRKQLIDEITNKTILVVTSERGKRVVESDFTLNSFLISNKISWIDKITPNPTICELQNVISEFKNATFDFIIAIGGGSVIDSAKVISVCINSNNRGFVLKDLLEDSTCLNYSIPVIALPTTAGTGSEVTPFATVWDDKEKRKCSLASKTLFPHTAIIDSELFTTLPDDVLISTGLDAINQAIESIWNKNATPITLSYAFQSLKIGMPALVNLTKDRTSNYYSNLGYSSLLSGLAISHTRTSICHSISYPITAHYQVPHGIACAFTMPEVLKLCIQTEPNLFAQLAKYLINNDSNVYDLLDYFVSFNKHFDVSNRIKKYINRIEDLYSISDKMITKGRMDNGIIDFNKNQIEKLLLNSWNL
jgi:phosphonate metabolism-associated iron-containing alcohol dehydrogenase